jgi:CRISPR-associated protein Csb2
MLRALLLHVRFAEGRYHGTGDWPPAPARLFQALVAAAASGSQLDAAARAALCWLETLSPPEITAPPARYGQAVRSYVPNNDLDAVDGDLARIGEIRTSKNTRPLLFETGAPLIYCWHFDPSAEAMEHAGAMIDLASRVYRLGRGVDFAWATAQIVDPEEAGRRLGSSNSPVWQPSNGKGGMILQAPAPGSLASLEIRFQATRRRFTRVIGGQRASMTFAQPPRASFQSVMYNAPNTLLLFDLRRGGTRRAEPGFAPWPLAAAALLVERIRDLVANRLVQVLPDQASVISRCIVGLGADDADKRRRIRILPLPSIGHSLVDPGIRRIVIEVPADCPVAAEDVEWAASGLDLDADPRTGEIEARYGAVLARADDRRILERYGVGTSCRTWQSATPVVLPQSAARRRLDPRRQKEPGEAKGAMERVEEEARATAAIVRSLRHAGIDARISMIELRREPLVTRGLRAERFAEGSRFAKERLWHVKVDFDQPIDGPLALGDGRYMGLGILYPTMATPRGIACLRLPPEAGVAVAQGNELVRAARRALMSLARQADGSVPLLFSGHAPDGAAARSGQHRHAFVAAIDEDGDGMVDTLVIAAPWTCDRTIEPDPRSAQLFDQVISGLQSLRAGRLGLLDLARSEPDDRLVGSACEWESHNDYRPTRHASDKAEHAEAVLQDVTAECRRRGMPEPRPEIIDLRPGPRGGVTARLRLRFAIAVAGPILLGRDSHAGGGVFMRSVASAPSPERP